MGEDTLWDSLLADGIRWLFRGVFLKSPEEDWLIGVDEITPPRPDRTGEEWRLHHMRGNTETGYTSWSIDRDTAYEFGMASSDDFNCRGRVVIFRVRVDSLSDNRGYQGREHEDEILIEGTVENVSVSDGYEDEEDDDDD